MNKQITKDDKKNIEKWITFLIRKIERENITKEEVLANLKGLKKYFFKKESYE